MTTPNITPEEEKPQNSSNYPTRNIFQSAFVEYGILLNRATTEGPCAWCSRTQRWEKGPQPYLLSGPVERLICRRCLPRDFRELFVRAKRPIKKAKQKPAKPNKRPANPAVMKQALDAFAGIAGRAKKGGTR